MLLQSQDGYIQILPALPDNWSKGRFTGLRARGGSEIGAEWDNGKLTNISIAAHVDNVFEIMVPEYASRILLNKKDLEITDGFIVIDMKRGDMFEIEVIAK